VSSYRNRNYPSLTLLQALEVPRGIQDGASGMPVSKLTLATILDRSPSASQLRDLILASRAYGLTEGGVNGDQFQLTPLGSEATGADEMAQRDAMRRAVLNVEPFRVFLTSYNGKKIPSSAPLKEFLVASAGVPPEWAEDCIEHLVADARAVGFIREVRGGEYIDLSESTPDATVAGSDALESRTDGDEEDEQFGARTGAPARAADKTDGEQRLQAPSPAKKVFIAHGKNRTPLEQLKKMLDQFKVKYAVAVDEPNRGRPISTKVANLMRDGCSSAIFIFTADERFLREDQDGETTEVWRPSENAVYELGAASILYDRRIVIFKEKQVTFPSDFSDLGYIEFEADQLGMQMGNLFSELVALDILEVRAKG
jgi:predicted nucleotide-binding protein